MSAIDEARIDAAIRAADGFHGEFRFIRAWEADNGGPLLSNVVSFPDSVYFIPDGAEFDPRYPTDDGCALITDTLDAHVAQQLVAILNAGRDLHAAMAALAEARREVERLRSELAAVRTGCGPGRCGRGVREPAPRGVDRLDAEHADVPRDPGRRAVRLLRAQPPRPHRRWLVTARCPRCDRPRGDQDRADMTFAGETAGLAAHVFEGLKAHDLDFAKELDRRGYDLTTLRFTVWPKSSGGLLPAGASTRLGAWLVEALPHLRGGAR